MNADKNQATVRCAVCGSERVEGLARVDQVPIHNSLLWTERRGALAAPRGDIHLGFCRSCGHFFNIVFDPTLTAYTQAYENSLHFSPLFQGYAQSLAERLVKRHALQEKEIIEIGCGQADFLTSLCLMGNNRGVGFDPAFVYESDPHGLFATGRLKVVQDYYSGKYSSYHADLIACRQVLEHIQSPRDFLSGIRRALGESSDTALFFEVPNVICPLRDMDIWTLIYEHCSYFSAQSLATLFELSGFGVAEVTDLYDGLFLGIDAFPAYGRNASSAPPARTITDLEGYASRFAENVSATIRDWEERFEQMRRQGNRVVVWGGGARGVTFLNVFRKHSLVEYVVDINPRKSGTFVPGTGQEFVRPEFLQKYKPDVVVMMNAIYRGEIQAELDRLGVNTLLLSV